MKKHINGLVLETSGLGWLGAQRLEEKHERHRDAQARHRTNPPSFETGEGI